MTCDKMSTSKFQELLVKHSSRRAKPTAIVDLKAHIRRPRKDTETPAHCSAPQGPRKSLNRLGVSALKLMVTQVLPDRSHDMESMNASLKELKNLYYDGASDEQRLYRLMELSKSETTRAAIQEIIDHKRLNGLPRDAQSHVPLITAAKITKQTEELQLKLLQYEGARPEFLEALKTLQKLIEADPQDTSDRATANLRAFMTKSGTAKVDPAYLSFIMHRIIALSGTIPRDSNDIVRTMLSLFEKGEITDLSEVSRLGTYKASSRTLVNDLSLEDDMKKLLDTIRTKKEKQDDPSGKSDLPTVATKKQRETVATTIGQSVSLKQLEALQFSQIASKSTARRPPAISMTTPKLSTQALSFFLRIDIDKIHNMALELGCNPEMLTAEEASFIIDELNIGYNIECKESKAGVTICRTKQVLVKRPLVATIMGHVDHGKTTLLDTLQKSNIASGEAGLITQKLGAFKVHCDEGTLVFVDTPGHAAFSRMRDRGVRCADAVVLVVAADDGVMPQTKEAIELIEREQLPFIVAVNKVDLDDGLHVKGMLEDCGLDLTNVPIVHISAKHNRNIDRLKAELFAMAERMNLVGDTAIPGTAYVFETGLHPTWGGFLRAIVRNGVLKENSWFVCQEECAKVKRMFDTYGKPIKMAMPSEIVQICWSNDISSCAGTMLHQCDSQARAQKMAALNKRRMNNATKAPVTLDSKSPELNMSAARAPNSDPIPEIGVVLRCGDQGGLEAVMQWIDEFNSMKRKNCDLEYLIERGYVRATTTAETLSESQWTPIRVVAKSVGPFNRSDSQFVDAGVNAFLGFGSNVPDGAARPDLVVTRNVIYELFNDIEKMYDFYFGATHLVKTEAQMHVTQTGSVTIKGLGKTQAIGTTVSSGTVRISHPCMLVREGKTIAKALELHSMQSSRKPTTELLKGDSHNCLIFKNSAHEVKVGDEIVSYTKEPLPPLFGVVTNCILS